MTSAMAEYRPLTADDVEQSAYVEAVAFYGKSTPERVEQQRKFFPPEWTVGAFVDGKLVADIRTVPMARRINGRAIGFGAVGPVACLAGYRRKGHVGKLLRLALERMREGGQALSGLHTPHDALYARYGWERAEGKKRYEFRPKDVTLRLKGAPGALEAVGNDDWPRLEAVYRAWTAPRNGPLHRVEPWWRENVLRHYDESMQRADNEAFVWRNAAGDDQGYVVYQVNTLPKEGQWAPHEIWVRDFVSLSGDAYLGLWQHLMTHDLALRVVRECAPDDPFSDLAEDPWKINVLRAEGAMIRVVDIERAIGMRPYCGERPVSFTMHIADRSGPWNEGVWRIEAAEGRMSAERTDGEADVELSANTLAPLFTGFMRPDVAASAGLLQVNRAEAVAEMAEAFAVTYPPFSGDYY
jgi:predicted acetyltransferase